MLLAYEALSTPEFEASLPDRTRKGTTSEFVAENYRFLKFDSNTWTNETTLKLYGWSLPDYIEQSIPKFTGTEMGRDFSVFARQFLYDDEADIEFIENSKYTKDPKEDPEYAETT